MLIKSSSSIGINHNEIEMLKLCEELLAVQEDRLVGRHDVTTDESDVFLDSVIKEAENEKADSLS